MLSIYSIAIVAEMSSYLSGRHSTAQLYAVDDVEIDAKELLIKNRTVLWKIYEYYCPQNVRIPPLTSDPQSSIIRRASPLVFPGEILVLFKDWGVIPSLLHRSMILDFLEVIGSSSGESNISFDQFCDLLLRLSMEVAIEQSNRFICFFDDEKDYRGMMSHVIKDTHPLDFPATVAGLRILLTVMDRSQGRCKFEKSRVVTIVPPFVGVEGSGLGLFDTFTSTYKSLKSPDVDEEYIEIEPLNEKSTKALRENESILISIALRYSVAPGAMPTKGRASPRRHSYYSLVEDAATFETRRQSVSVPFDALWRLLNDFGVCPDVVR